VTGNRSFRLQIPGFEKLQAQTWKRAAFEKYISGVKYDYVCQSTWVVMEVVMWPERVSFHSYPGSFRVRCLRCDNIECTCTAVTFQLVEARARNQVSEPPLRISITLDVPTWREIDAPPRSPEIRELVAEFLRDYPQAERELMKQWFHDRRRMVERLDECLAAPEAVETGMLIDFDEIVGGFDDPVWVYSLGEYDTEFESVLYHAKERYCLNPDCDCGTVHVSFFSLSSSTNPQGKRIFEEHFQAALSLDGDARLDKVFHGERSVAEQVLAKWQKENGRDLKYLRWRYNKMKEIGRRTLEAAPEAEYVGDGPLLSPVRRPSDRVGRNEPCPCGSGKKYKKCCGRSGEAGL